MKYLVAATLAISGLIHADLYVDGYHVVPMIGPAFLVQASSFLALAVLIAVGGPRWLYWVAAAGAAGSLIAFAMSRTVGIFGFVEHGWEPPLGVGSVVVELATIVLCIAGLRVTRLRIHL
jgi:hypothetical protein